MTDAELDSQTLDDTPNGCFADRTFIMTPTNASAVSKDSDYIYWCDDDRYQQSGAIGR